MNRYAFVQGHLRQVRPCWAWLFRILGIGMELPDTDLREVMEAMMIYQRKAEAYLRVQEVQG